MGWSSREDLPDNVAIISIAGTPEIQKNYLKDKEDHWFEEGPNVLNLNFDDVPEDIYEYDGFTFYGLDMNDAKRAVEFMCVPEQCLSLADTGRYSFFHMRRLLREYLPQ